MRIGIGCALDLSVFKSYFPNTSDRKKLEEETFESLATAVHTLIKAYLDKGFFVRIFCLSKTTFFVKGNNIEIFGVRAVQQYPVEYLWGNFINARQIRIAMKGNVKDLDLLHAHWTRSYAYAASYYSDSLPIFCTVRDWVPYIWKIESPKNKITWSFIFLMSELVFSNKNIHFIANSNYTAERIEKKTGKKVPIIPNPIKKSFLLKEKRIVPENLELTCISTSIDKRKNLKTLLLAFKKLRNDYEEARLSLIGQCFVEESPNIQEWYRQGLMDGVNLIGAVDHDELPKYIDKASIYVTPSLEETFGNTLLEAMAREVPIVAGENSGAIPYVLSHGKAGFLCDVSKVDELYEKIKFVFENPEIADEKIQFSKKLLLEKYLDDKVVESNIFSYQRVINEL